MSYMITDSPLISFYPNKVLFGLNKAGDVAYEVRTLNGSNVLIVTDPGVVKANILSPVIKSLEDGGISYSIYDNVKPEPPFRNVTEATELGRANNCDIIIGIGGGSSMDVAKAVSAMMIYEGKIEDICGANNVRCKPLPKILIPTTAGTGSEVTNVFVLTDEAANIKKGAASIYLLAEVAIIDPKLTITMPANVTADTGVDALVHAIEAFVSTDATPFTDMLTEKAIRIIGKYLPIAYLKAANIEARYFMSLAATMAGMALPGQAVRIGAVHALAYPLGTEHHMSHGRTNAIMLPHVMEANLWGNIDRYAKIAELLGKDISGLSHEEAARSSIYAVQELLKIVNISIKLRDYGINEKDISALVKGVKAKETMLLLNPRDLNEENVNKIYQKAL